MPKRTKHLDLPRSDSPLLADVLESIRRRSKSIKHGGWRFQVDRVFEEYSDGRVEKLEIRIQYQELPVHLDIDVWDDRWVLVSAYKRTEMEKWHWEFQGRLMPDVEDLEFMRLIEMSQGFQFTDQGRADLLESIWGQILGRGPRPVD